MKTRTGLALFVAGALSVIPCVEKVKDSVKNGNSLTTEIQRLEDWSFGPYTMQKLHELYTDRLREDIYGLGFLALSVIGGGVSLIGAESLGYNLIKKK